MKRLVCQTLFLSSVTFTVSARAQQAHNPFSTLDSRIRLAAAGPEGARWLRVVIQKKGVADTQDQIVAWAPGAELPTLTLPQGAGEYDVHVYASKAETFTDNQYVFLKSYQVENDSKQDQSYLLPSLEIQSEDPEIRAIAHLVVQEMPLELEKSQMLHDWVTANIAYDEDGLHQKTSTRRPADAVSVLRGKLALCVGYANLTAALHRAAGLRAKVIVGKLIGQAQDKMTATEVCGSKISDHAWNEVLVEGRWIIVDTTLDAGSEDGDTHQFRRSPNDQTYFDADPAVFSRTHVKCREELQ
jgi:transglutaminase-like putative cysteine protease